LCDVTAQNYGEVRRFAKKIRRKSVTENVTNVLCNIVLINQLNIVTPWQ